MQRITNCRFWETAVVTIVFKLHPVCLCSDEDSSDEDEDETSSDETDDDRGGDRRLYMTKHSVAAKP